MSRWQEFGFPDNLKFTSPLKAIQGITLAVKERLSPFYPDLAGSWYEGNRYLETSFIRRTLAPMYQIVYGLESNWYNQGITFPLNLPNNALVNSLCTLPRKTLYNPARTVHGFWDYSKNASGILELTETEYLASPYMPWHGTQITAAELSCIFDSFEAQTMQEVFRFDNVFSERYFLYLYHLVNPLKSYLTFYVRQQGDGSFHYFFKAESIANLAFSD